MKTINIEKENLLIFRTTSEIIMKFLEKMYLMINQKSLNSSILPFLHKMQFRKNHRVAQSDYQPSKG